MLTLKNGHFHREGKKIKPKFGNKEQIDFLKYNRHDDADYNYYEVHIDGPTVVCLAFTCMCGDYIVENRYTQVNHLINTRNEWHPVFRHYWIGRKISCSCGIKWEIEKDDYGGLLAAGIEHCQENEECHDI